MDILQGVASSSSFDSIVVVHSGNGKGSTDTRIRRFTTILTNDGTDITYAESAANGSTFTINTTGVYFMAYSDLLLSSVVGAGISLNSTELTTSLSSVAVADRITFSIDYGATGQSFTYSAITYPLSATDVIRAHLSTAGNLTAGDFPRFTIARVG